MHRSRRPWRRRRVPGRSPICSRAPGHTVLTRHLLDDNVDSAESILTEREVFARDMQWLNGADLLIAEASGSSYGVGFEVGYVLGRSDITDQRVLLLYDARASGRSCRA